MPVELECWSNPSRLEATEKNSLGEIDRIGRFSTTNQKINQKLSGKLISNLPVEVRENSHPDGELLNWSARRNPLLSSLTKG